MRNAPRKNGLIPVMCRITVNGKISQFSCKLDVEEKHETSSLGTMKHCWAVFRQHNEDYKKQAGKIKSLRIYWKSCIVCKHLEEFIKQRYKVS